MSPHYWGKEAQHSLASALCIVPGLCCWDRHFPCSTQTSGPLPWDPCRRFFLCPLWFLSSHVLSALYTRLPVGPSAPPQSCLSAQRSSPKHSAFWTLVTFVHLDFQLHFLTSESTRLLLSSPLLHSLETLTSVDWTSHRAHIICFPALKDHYPLLPDSQCLEHHCFIYFV